MLRLRQIALVASELRGVEQDICEQLGLEVCYRDPGLSQFGLRHGLYAIGDQLLEVGHPNYPAPRLDALLSAAATAATWCYCRPMISCGKKPG